MYRRLLGRRNNIYFLYFFIVYQFIKKSIGGIKKKWREMELKIK